MTDLPTSYIDPDIVASLVVETYLSFPASCVPSKRSNGVQEWTPLAGVVLSRTTDSSPILKLISVGAGSKVVPTIRKSARGDIVNDLHAEILSIRGARRWILEEVGRCLNGADDDWLEQITKEGRVKWKLKTGVQVHMYISTLPCGDASTVHLANQQQILDPDMAALKSSHHMPSETSSDSAPSGVNAPRKSFVLARGRDGYSSLGVIRTKPGRADSSPTTTLSCSDKLAAYTLLGIQGSVLSTVVEPIYLSTMVIGDIKGLVDNGFEGEKIIHEELDRALVQRARNTWSSLQSELPNLSYRHHPPRLNLTKITFSYSKSLLLRDTPDLAIATPSICLVYTADDKPERLVALGHLHGSFKKSIQAAGGRLPDKAVSGVCRKVLFALTLDILNKTRDEGFDIRQSYRSLKKSFLAFEYQQTKQILRTHPMSFLCGWEEGDREQWESFDSAGDIESLDVEKSTSSSVSSETPVEKRQRLR
ncbi:tRNA-specific adenosine deaminase 1 [Phaffia rhodozyma]|uniref:tRNA-specific adenosine deaminase 1 n=1 Tax=Phaffia rhodozyma TaxID=264483 RepID=A0A0F7SNM8_PHARH|nr:tRNA-specific adenosine deaminase 1 [Phaffia rhodozyma]